MRLSSIAVLALLAFAGCPKKTTPQQAPPPNPVLPQLQGQQADTGQEPTANPPTTPPGQSAGSSDEDMRREFLANLTESHDRLAARLDQYRAAKPNDPGVARADSLLRTAAARLTALATVKVDDDFPMKLHGVNSLFFETEQLLQAAGY